MDEFKLDSKIKHAPFLNYLVCCGPLLGLFLYLVIFYIYALFLDTNTTLINLSIPPVDSINKIDEAMYRNFWGVALIVASVANAIMLIITFTSLYITPGRPKLHFMSKTALVLVGLILWWIILKGNLGGGIASDIYIQIRKITESKLESIDLPFKSIIDVSVANGYLAVYAVAILLTKLCFVAKSGDIPQRILCLKIYDVVFVSTATFLSLSILQIFFQYQWFNVFLSYIPDQVKALKIVTFGFPVAMSIFYVSMFFVIFFPAEILLKQLVNFPNNNNNNNNNNNDDDDGEEIATKPKLGYKRFSSIIIFLSPFLTAALAELTKVFVTPS